MPALGDKFREAREARGLTLSDVAEQIRIRSVYLAAIEEENWPAIGAPIYVRGFLRTYARFLALSPEEAVSQFNAEMGDREVFETPTPGPTRYVAESEPKNFAPLLWIASVVAVLLIGYVVYSAMGLQNRTASTQVSARAMETDSPNPALSGSPSPVSPSPSPAPTVLPNSISVLATAPTWLRITVDGTTRYEGVLRTGTIQAFRGKTATVRIGNAGGARVTIDGKPVGALGKPGQVVDRAFNL